jgi:hypothetical protein
MEVKRSKFNQVKYKRQEIQQVDPSEFKTRFENGINKEKSYGWKQVMYRAVNPYQMGKV